MFCGTCGGRVEMGASSCPACGAAVRAPASAPGERASPPSPPAAQLIPAATEPARCARHPALPVLGTCPRCGRGVCVVCAPGAKHMNYTCQRCPPLEAPNSPVPEGALCAQHPTVSASFVCSRCGSFGCPTCAGRVAAGEAARCNRCQTTSFDLATIESRFFASLVDGLVLWAPLVAWGVAGLMRDRSNNPAPGLGVVTVSLGVLLMLAALGQLWAQVHWGQTWGKRMTRIRVVRSNGSEVELWRLLLLRNVTVQLASQLCGVVGLVDALMIFGPQRRCLHDLIADTIVIDAPRTDEP